MDYYGFHAHSSHSLKPDKDLWGEAIDRELRVETFFSSVFVNSYVFIAQQVEFQCQHKYGPPQPYV